MGILDSCELMLILSDGLSKDAQSIYRHNLTGSLESALRASNAQYDNPDTLSRLDVRLLEVFFKSIKAVGVPRR